MPRLFVAISIPQHISNEIVKVQNQIENLGFDATFVKAEKFHITLKFIGQIDKKLVDQIIEDLNSIVFKQFTVNLNGLGFFQEGKNKPIWIKVNSAQLQKLKLLIEQTLDWIDGEKTVFIPHITITRLEKTNKKLIKEKILPIQFKQKFIVTEFNLIETILGKSIYKNVVTFDL